MQCLYIDISKQNDEYIKILFPMRQNSLYFMLFTFFQKPENQSASSAMQMVDSNDEKLVVRCIFFQTEKVHY